MSGVAHFLRESGLSLQLSENALEKLDLLSHELSTAGEHVNLTAISGEREIAIHHFADSLALLDGMSLAEGTTAADIGSGAGFPLLPLAIAIPGMTWTAIESIGKKCRFIESVAARLGLMNVQVVNARAEEAGHDPTLRGSFDYVTARAVGPIPSLSEVAIPLLKTGGSMMIWKTESALAEWAASSDAIHMLGGEISGEYRYQLPGDSQDRLILQVTKHRSTPETYPRRAGVPFRKPLS